MIGKNKDGVWYYAIKGKKGPDGIYPQIKHQDKNWLKKDAQREYQIMKMKLKGAIHNITVGQLFILFFEHKKSKLKLRSTSSMLSAYEKHIKPTFEHMLVNEITHRDIIVWQQSLLNQGFKNRYLEKIQAIFKGGLLFGVKYSYIEKNPFTIDIARNKNEIKTEMMYWTVDEFNQFIEYVDDPIYEAFFKMLYWCGLRQGEAIGLLKSDIDFIKGTVNVNKSYDNYNHIVNTPKTHNSYRIISLPEVVLKALDKLMLEYRQIDGYNENIILFGFNKHLHHNTIKARQLEACRLSKVKVIRIHDMRHSHVSVLINLGFSPFEIAKRLGHSVDMVNNVYGHLFPEKDKLMADRLNHIQEKSLISLKN